MKRAFICLQRRDNKEQHERHRRSSTHRRIDTRMRVARAHHGCVASFFVRVRLVRRRLFVVVVVLPRVMRRHGHVLRHVVMSNMLDRMLGSVLDRMLGWCPMMALGQRVMPARTHAFAVNRPFATAAAAFGGARNARMLNVSARQCRRRQSHNEEDE